MKGEHPTRLRRSSRYVAAALLVFCAVAAHAQNPAKPQSPRIVKGTTQLDGENAKFGLAYTLNAKSPRALNITITSAALTLSRWNAASGILAGKDEKILLLTYTIHNPNKEITHYDSSILKLTVVDQEDVNHESVSVVTRKDGIDVLSIDLKPAQKIECQTAFIVPAKGTVPKLIVAHHEGGAVLRYDLRKDLTGLEAPFADGDPTNAKAEVAGEKDRYYPALAYDVMYVSSAAQERKFGPNTLPDDKVWFLTKFRMKKQTASGPTPRFVAQLITEDGDRLPDYGMKKGSAEEGFSGAVEFGQEVAFRMIFSVPKTMKPTAVRIWEFQGKESRTYVFPIEADVMPTAPAGTSAAQPATPPAATGLLADDYASTFKNAKGEVVMEVGHTELREGKVKKTELTVAGKKAILNEDLESGAVALYLPDTNETLRAPKPMGKEPQTSLAYFEMAYANSAAPKPKKRNPLGGLGGSLLGNVAGSVGSSLISGAFGEGLGSIAVSQIAASTAKSTLRGYTVQEFNQSLGRATMSSSRPEGDGPERVRDEVSVDKNVYVTTEFKSRRGVQPGSFAVDASSAKDVDAKTLFKRFADFMGQGLK